MSALYSVIGESNPTYLLADPQGADLISIPCEPGHETIFQGQLMYRKATGLYAPAAAENIIGTNNLVVLNEAVDTSADLTISEDAAAYRAGRLIASKLLVSGGSALTAAQKLVLRQQGILLDVMDEAGMDYSNSLVSVTYDANGGTGDDVAVAVQEGTDYTIAANAFTPPDGKVFSKWNTAADGTGTDYEPAATYTANAALTLYAVWVDA